MMTGTDACESTLRDPAPSGSGASGHSRVYMAHDQQFDGPTALASYLGVTPGAVCNATREAKQRGNDTFMCGKVNKALVSYTETATENVFQDADCGAEGVMTISDETHDRQYMPVLQFHAHLQAAALRLFPSRKLMTPERTSHQKKFVPWISLDKNGGQGPMFDLAQVWSMHSPSSYVTPYGFRRALTGENQDSPISELTTAKYPSVTILKFWDQERPDKSKYRAHMNAQDILKFMMSDFARKGQFDEIFEETSGGWKGPPELVSLVCGTRTTGRAQAPAPEVQRAEPPGSPRFAHDFARGALQRMREVEENFAASSEIEQAEGHAKRRRLLANAAIVGITRVLFDANKLLLDAMVLP